MTLEQVNALTDEEIRARIAEICGFKFVKAGKAVAGIVGAEVICPRCRAVRKTKWAHDTHEHECGPMATIGAFQQGNLFASIWIKNGAAVEIPDYPRDLNACLASMHALNTELLKCRFALYLTEVVASESIDKKFSSYDWCNASAIQRAKAFLMVMA